MGTAPGSVAIFTFTFDAGGCIVPAISCISQGGQYEVTIALEVILGREEDNA